MAPHLYPPPAGENPGQTEHPAVQRKPWGLGQTADFPAASESGPQAEPLSSADCPACGSPDFQPLFSATDRLYQTTRAVFQIVECGRCRLIRLSPQPTASELIQYYPPNYWFVPEQDAAGRLEQLYRRFVLRDHLRFVTRALADSAPESLVLDVGCGGGLFLAMLKEKGRRVVGLDFSLDAAAAAWSHHRVPVVRAALSQPPLQPGSCGAITMFHLLEHLHDPRSYLDAARQLLAKDGRLIVQVPNAACWQFMVLGENWNGLDVPRHLYNFRDSDLEFLLDACGFEVLRRKYFSLRDNPAGLATSLLPSLDPVARRIRGAGGGPVRHFLCDLFYLALVTAALPFTVLEASCRAGSTVMMEARRKQ